MNIIGDCIYGQDVFEVVCRVSFFKTERPWRRFWTTVILYAVILVLALTQFWLDDELWFPITMTAVSVIMLAILFLRWYMIPRWQYRGAGALKDVKQTYLFSEQEVEITLETEGVGGQSHFRYDKLFRVIETTDYLLLYQNKGSAFLVDRSSLRYAEGIAPTEPPLETLRTRLKAVASDYRVCDY